MNVINNANDPSALINQLFDEVEEFLFYFYFIFLYRERINVQVNIPNTIRNLNQKLEGFFFIVIDIFMLLL
jgi:hypothetical protein